MPPIDIYKRAVTAMHAIQPPPYLQFDTRVTTNIRDGIIVQHITHVERTSDMSDLTRMVDENLEQANNYTAEPFEISPDLFLGHTVTSKPISKTDALTSGLDDLNDKPLKTIAVVSVAHVHYSASTVGIEDVPRCNSAIHLKLEPLEKPLIYNLRDLWIDSGTSRICKAVAVWSGHVNSRKVVASVFLDLNRAGFIDHYNTFVTVHFFIGGPITVKQDASYEAFQPVDEGIYSSFESSNIPVTVKN